jgi:hypothetical protein
MPLLQKPAGHRRAQALTDDPDINRLNSDLSLVSSQVHLLETKRIPDLDKEIAVLKTTLLSIKLMGGFLVALVSIVAAVYKLGH